MAKLAVIKTRETGDSVEGFLETVPDEQKRSDSKVLAAMMKKLSGEKPRLWGASLVGFGKVRAKSERSGREVEWFLIGFSPRKTALSIYLNCDIKADGDLLKKLGKHKTGKGCLYVNRLEDIDLKVLETLIKRNLAKK